MLSEVVFSASPFILTCFLFAVTNKTECSLSAGVLPFSWLVVRMVREGRVLCRKDDTASLCGRGQKS